MRPRTIVLIPILLAISVRIALILQSPGLMPEAYGTLLHVQHIIETGLPMLETTTAWGGAHTQAPSLFYYLISFAAIFIGEATAALWIPNLIISLLPIPIYLLATQLTKNTTALMSATMASAFIPILYADTILSASPLTLALPLFFLAYYYFIRIAKTPKYQIHFITTTALLVLTHPVSLLLGLAMGLTILFTYVQRTRFSQQLAEVSIFTVFLTIWANIVIYKKPIQWFGINALNMHTEAIPHIATMSVLVGVIALIAGVWAAFTYLTEEKDLSGHALIALLGAIIITMLSTLLSIRSGLMLLGGVLAALTAGAVHRYMQARRRARIPILYTLMYTGIVLVFIITTTIPSLTLGAQSISSVLTQEDHEILASLPKGSHVLWDEQHGYFLQYHGHTVPYNTNILEHAEAPRMSEDIQELYAIQSEIRFIQALNKHNIEVIIPPPEHRLPIHERCFTKLHNQHEVYKLICVVQ